jgi:thiol-disulfide isomerase/thioredoxin
VLTTLGAVKTRRLRLLAGSLAVAIVVSLLGGYAWSRIAGGDPPPVDAQLTRSTPQVGGPEEIVPNGKVVGEPLPATMLSDRDGNDVGTASLLGAQPLVINFWVSTCAPCAKELPEFSAAHSEFGDAVRFVGVNRGIRCR